MNERTGERRGTVETKEDYGDGDDDDEEEEEEEEEPMS